MSRRRHWKLSKGHFAALSEIGERGPDNVHVNIAVADSEYSPFPPRIQSGPRGHLTIVGIRTPIARLRYSPPLSRHTPTRPRLFSFSLRFVSLRYVLLRYATS
ncbi:unnamed protein product [Callosobruchus maculatus]|uniref:Uncharacterized protein n=1 Tax=Callosobruchus maculatus TaxID=64391 RepID=A0A653DAI2_CALMS|nr:unnamed protein product [Callosobruchus maculatus]VEN56867.1 unnamed protein product [Callosobruchus maculatus]